MPEVTREFCIIPHLEPALAANLKRQVEQLDRLLDNPHTGPKPIGQSGMLEQIGSLLWNASGLNAPELLEAISDAREDQHPVRIVVTGEKFQGLPWELLYNEHPELGFLGRHSWCVLTRRTGDARGKVPRRISRPLGFLRFIFPARFLDRHRRIDHAESKAPRLSAAPLRVLLFISSPEDLPPERSRLDFEREEELLFSALDRPLAKGIIAIDVAEDGSLDTLLDRLQNQSYHAIILSMHGTVARKRNGNGGEEWGLLFEDKLTGRSAPLAGSDLVAGLEKLPAGRRPGLVVLSACRSAKAEETAASISSVALRLHESGVERVLGMRLSVLDGAAAAFSAELFRRLAQGEVLGRAVSLARHEVAGGAWLSAGEASGLPAKDGKIGDLFGQWSLPVLLDRTADGPMIDLSAAAEVIERPPPSSVLIGDGTICLPSRASFIGRRSLIREHLGNFLEGKTRCLLFTGPGGVGKTTVAGLFARSLCERQSAFRLLGFRAPIRLDAVYEPLRCEAFDGHEEASLLPAIQTEPDIRERLRRLLVSLAGRKDRPFAVVLDNLESLQDLRTLEIASEHEESLWFLRTVCALPWPTRVLLTGRYALRVLPEDGLTRCPVPDAPYGDVLRRMQRLNWPSAMPIEKKRWVFSVLGGNHRSLEWAAQLFADGDRKADELLQAIEKVQAPPETVEGTIQVVLEAMRQDLLFATLRAQLTTEQDWLLRTASLYRAPVSDDGLRAIARDQANYEEHRRRLIDYSLLEGGFDRLVELEYFAVPGVVKELLGEGGFNEGALKGLHRAMANYHRFQGSHVSRRWADDLEAIFHFRRAEDHALADELAEGVCGFYYRISNFADANKLAEEIAERDIPSAPWWALNRYGMCQLMLGFPERAVDAFKRALPDAPTEKDQGTTLNNISQIFMARGDYETALKYLEQSLRIMKEIGDKAGMIPTLHNMAHIALGAEDLQRAVDLWSEALSLAMETGNAEGTFHVAWALGSIRAQVGEKQQGRRLLELAVEVGLKVGFPEVGKVQTMLRSMG